ncbi:MAG: hypothetical protein Q7S58_16910 [Candidatus Binatus sp.]|uniref:hypothetical protein n=1 Tax=Candidatus Binatus sp. TaxID=2811406 RepID=UPI00271BC062|nr:hypothetical protein [Candidatus Binatus sp.]MDO8434080.1 hypothetical protein [Candidatus Binatus sp.]
MPCCAFAAFIVGQILIGLDGFKRFVLRRDAAIVPDNAATAWRLDGAGSPAPGAGRAFSGRRSIRWIAIAASLEVALAIGGIYGIRAHHHAAHHHASQLASAEVSRGPALTPAR